MPKRVPTISVVVVRENDQGKNVRKTVEPGKPFNFTADEIEQITRIHPGALRKPLNETADTTISDETAPERDAKPSATEGETKPVKKPKKAAAAPKTPKPETAEDVEAEEDAEEEAASEDDDI